MAPMLVKSRRALWAVFLVCTTMVSPKIHSISCTTQSQMPPAQRTELSNTARTILAHVQTGDAQGIRQMTVPSVAANFVGISNAVTHLQPSVQSAVITVDALYLLDASESAAGASQTDFFCGSPVVSMNFNGLPAGTYALAILHATGVPHPQVVSLILSKSADNRWLLGGMMQKPMTGAGHDGLWYWESARKYAQTRMNWDSWFYYRMAENLLRPMDSISSPNLEKLQHEAQQVHPAELPGSAAMSFNSKGMLFTVNAIDTSTALGALDLDVHYTPDATEAAQLHDPVAARQQVTAIMTGLLTMHPELRSAFHGIWVHADQGTNSLFALELPMDQIAGVAPAANPMGVTGPR